MELLYLTILAWFRDYIVCPLPEINDLIKWHIAFYRQIMRLGVYLGANGETLYSRLQPFKCDVQLMLEMKKPD